MRKLLSVCALIVAFAVQGSAASDVRAMVAEARALRLGKTAAVTGLKVESGHMTLTMTSATASVVLAGERPVGVFLDGAGTVTYTTEDADELSALRYNAKNGGVDAKIDGNAASIVVRFRNALLRGHGVPEVKGAEVTAPAHAFAAVLATLERQKFSDPPEHLAMLQKANAPDAHLLRADIRGTDKSFVYIYDDAWRREETFSVLRSRSVRAPGGTDWLVPTLLSKQAIGRSGRVTAPQNVQLTDVDVTLVNTEHDRATLTVIETLVPRRTLQVLRFDLYSDYIYDIEKAPRKYNVRRITDDKGNQLSFDHANGSLLVGLATPAAPNVPLKLRFEIDGEILYRPEGSNYWELGIEPWFPMLTQSEQGFRYHAVVKVRKPFIAFTSGTTVRREVEGDWNVVETRIDQPIGYVAILAGRYQYDEKTRNGVTVRVASFLVKNQTAWEKLQNIAFTVIETYPKFLGPFPFTEVNIIERNDYGWGQAPAGLVFITKEAFTPMLGDANDYVKGINLRIAHELAHMYWGSGVRVASSEEQWIDESFAEYSSAMLFRLVGRPEFYDQAFAEWKTGAKRSSKIASIPMANRLVNPGDPVGSFTARQDLIYSKGAALLAVLHGELGDKMFLTFLKSYQKSFRGRFATTADVSGLLQYMTKTDYAPFFERYFYGTELPEIRKPSAP